MTRSNRAVTSRDRRGLAAGGISFFSSDPRRLVFPASSGGRTAKMFKSVPCKGTLLMVLFCLIAWAGFLGLHQSFPEFSASAATCLKTRLQPQFGGALSGRMSGTGSPLDLRLPSEWRTAPRPTGLLRAPQSLQ